jgi:hypothetical protein
MTNQAFWDLFFGLALSTSHLSEKIGADDGSKFIENQ